MLPALARMRRSADFSATVRRGRRASAPLVTVHLVTVDSSLSGADVPAQVGFVVSRSVGTAVVRNGVRRRLRHLMRERLATVPNGAAVVVRAHPGAAAASSTTLGRDLDRALHRLARPSAKGRS